MSGKRNNLEDSLIVQFECPRLLGSYNRKLNPSAAPARPPLEHLLDSPKNQFLSRTTFARCTAFQPPINRIRYVDCRPHSVILPCLWLQGKVNANPSSLLATNLPFPRSLRPRSCLLA